MSAGGSGWGKLQYDSWDHEKVEAAGNRAWGVFVRAVAWSGYRRKDGWISTQAMRKIERDLRVWDRLLEVGLLDSRTEDGATLHDWDAHNETSARKSERENSLSIRGKLGAAAKHGAGHSQPPATDTPLPGSARSEKKREEEKREEEIQSDRPEAGQLTLVAPEPKRDPAREIFDAYLEARKAKTGGKHPPVLSDKRRALVAARLKDHPVEQLVDAVRGVWASGFHVERGFTEFDLVLRDAEHVERFAALAVPAGPPPRKVLTEAELDVLRERGEYPRTPPPPELTHAEKIAASDARIAKLDAEARARGETPKPFAPFTLEQIHEFAEDAE